MNFSWTYVESEEIVLDDHSHARDVPASGDTAALPRRAIDGPHKAGRAEVRIDGDEEHKLTELPEGPEEERCHRDRCGVEELEEPTCRAMADDEPNESARQKFRDDERDGAEDDGVERQRHTAMGATLTEGFVRLHFMYAIEGGRMHLAMGGWRVYQTTHTSR